MFLAGKMGPTLQVVMPHQSPSFPLTFCLILCLSVLKFILFFCGRCQSTSRTTHSSLTKYTNPSLAHLSWILISNSCKPTRAGRVPQRHTLPPSGRRFTRRLGRRRDRPAGAFGRGTSAEPPGLAPSARVMALSLETSFQVCFSQNSFHLSKSSVNAMISFFWSSKEDPTPLQVSEWVQLFHCKAWRATLPNLNSFSSSSPSKTQGLWSTCHQDIAVCWSPGPLPFIPRKSENLTLSPGYTTPAAIIPSGFVILGNNSALCWPQFLIRSFPIILFSSPPRTYFHGDTLAWVINNKCFSSKTSVSYITHWSWPLQQFFSF